MLIAGNHIRVEIFPNRIEIENPGRFPGPADPAKPLSISRYARNPRIVRVSSDLGIARELGEGIKRSVTEMRTPGLTDPIYSQGSRSVLLVLSSADALIRAMMACLRPKPGQTVADPACGTGGFLLAAHEWVVDHHITVMDVDDKRFLRDETVHGWEIVDGTARLCSMNLLLHGIGTPTGRSVITVGDALRADPAVRFDVVAANPPFGRKSSMTMVNEAGEVQRDDLVIVRDDFWASTSNKQLNFLQHIKTMLKVNGRAAVVLPDNVLFEAGAGETIRRRLMAECDLHTILRLPTGIFYAQGVKANVLFFDRKPAAADPWTRDVWVYDLRTNMHFTLKTKPLRYADLEEFVDAYRPEDRSGRMESERFHRFGHEQVVARDKANLDITWLRDETLDDGSTLPPPAVLAAEIVEDLEAALAQFTELAATLPVAVEETL